MPNRVQVSTSMWGNTLRWLISRSPGSRSRSGARIRVRSRIRTRTSVPASRSTSASVSCTWSFHTVTSWPSSMAKQSSVLSVSK